MKHKLLFFAFIILVALVIPQSVLAYDFSAVAPNGQTLYYSYSNGSSGNNVYVTYPGSSTSPQWNGYTKPTGALVIPSSVTYNGHTYSVIEIGNSAFYGCSGLTSVTIGNSVTSIGGSAFQNCSGLTSVTIGNSVTSIGGSAFRNCSGLISINVTSGNTHYDSRNNCNAIIETSTNTLVFGCQNTIIPNSVTNIGNSAFYGCSGLTSITIPNSVTSIGSSAFAYCSGLTSVTIPNSVTSIGEGAFRGCSGLTAVNFNAVNCTTMGSSTYPVFEGCSSLSTVNIGDSVTTIPAYAFYGCSGLPSVTIPNSVTSIGSYAFRGCSGLTTVNFNAVNCTTMGSLSNPVFEECISLSTVNIGDSVTTIPAYAFRGCSGLTSLNIPDSVTIIGSEAFRYCDHITNITLGKQLSSIGSNAFGGCTQIINITVRSQTPPTIQSNTFHNLNENINLKVPCNSVEAYENAAYWHNCNIEGQFSFLFSVTCDENRGRVRILEQPSCESAEAQIEAIPYHGFYFAGWNDGNTDNPRWIVVTHDTELTAIFADGNEDISNAECGDRVKVYSQYGVIVVSGAEGLPVSVYNIEGREIVTLNAGNHISVPVPAYGVYLVKVGNHPAKKVVVIR